MLHKKITAVLLIVLFQQIGAASAYAQTQQPEGQVYNAGRIVTNQAKREVQTEVSKAVWERYAKAALIKHAQKKVVIVAATAAAGVAFGPVGIAAGFAALFIDVGLSIYELESTPEAKRRREINRRLKQVKAENEAWQRRLKRQNLNQADFYNDRISNYTDLGPRAAHAKTLADLKRELLRRELQSDPPKPGQPYLRDDQQRTLREINEADEYVRKERERAKADELALQEALARQTTGLAPPIGDARSGPWWHTPWHTRPTDVSDTSPPELLPPLPPRLPDWRRRKDVVPPLPPRKPASGQLLGGKGLNIAGILNVFAFDSARQDGDSVQLTVRDSRGTILSRTITLKNAGSSANVLARRGIANVTITALNEGKYPPNTGGLRVRGSVSGVRSGNFNLSRGQSGTLTVRVLGR